MIFYFTATGNSKYIAGRIAAGTGDRTIDIADCVQNGQLYFELEDSESLGFVVPVYFFGIPVIVSEFLQKLKVSAGHRYYSYAVLNCGGTTGNAEIIFKRVFLVSAVFAVVTVDNYVLLYKVVNETEIKERLDKAESEIKAIVEHIGKKNVGSFDKVKGPCPRLFTFAAYPLYMRGRKTKKFNVNESCNGCGLCERICPRKAIQLKRGKPVWTISQCEHCLACLHRCPKAAINYGKMSAGNGRYVNLRVKF